MGIKGDLLVKRGYRRNYRQEPMEGIFNELRERTGK